MAGVAAGFGTMNDDHQIIIGEREGWGDVFPFGISAADHCHHIYIIGKTGTGKSTMLENMAIDDIESFKREIILTLFADNTLLQQLVLRLSNQLQDLAPPERRDLNDERPPHY